MNSADPSLNCTGSGTVNQADLALVMKVRTGSQTAFAELQRLYAPCLYRRILSIT